MLIFVYNLTILNQYNQVYNSNLFYNISEKFMRIDMLNNILNELNSSSADVEASAIISTDGLIMASQLPSSIDEDRVGAMSAAMLSLGDRTAQELERGNLDQVLIKGSNGYVLMVKAGEDAVLTVMAKANAKLGLIFLDVKRAAKKTSELI